MTECSHKIIKWWKSNKELLPYFEQGVLDCSFFDVEHPTAVSLILSPDISSISISQGRPSVLAV